MIKHISKLFVLALVLGAFLLPAGATEVTGADATLDAQEIVSVDKAEEPTREVEDCPSGTFPCSCNGKSLGCTNSVLMCYYACMGAPELAESFLFNDSFDWMTEASAQDCAVN